MQQLKESNIWERFPNFKIIVIASLAKALGIPGGVILSNKKTIEAIRKNPVFVGASPIVPAYLFAFLNAQNVYTEARGRLLNNILFFKNQLKKQQVSVDLFKYLPNYPIFHTTDNRLYDFLFKHKILISSFSYPNPNSPPITRIVLSALHTEGDIETLVLKIKYYTKTSSF